MNLVDILDIECIYYTIITQLSNSDCYNLLCVNKRINKLLGFNGFLKELFINNTHFDSIDSLYKTHDIYSNHKRYIQVVKCSNIDNPIYMLPKLSNIHLYIDNCTNIHYDRSIENITTLIITECEDLDIYQFSHCKHLKQLSIYNEQNRYIYISEMSYFNALEILFVNGMINLKKIVANNLKEIYTTCNMALLMNSYIYTCYPKLEILFITTLDRDITLKICDTRLKNIGILYDKVLYLQNNNRKDIMNIFIQNCNRMYSKIVHRIYTKKIMSSVSLFLINNLNKRNL